MVCEVETQQGSEALLLLWLWHLWDWDALLEPLTCAQLSTLSQSHSFLPPISVCFSPSTRLFWMAKYLSHESSIFLKNYFFIFTRVVS